MCLILGAYRAEPHCPLIIAANRDESFARPALGAHFWPDHPEMFGGRDLKESGTWLGVTRTGRFAAVTNWSHVSENKTGYRSRGDLVREFLIVDASALEFLSTIERGEYRGCNLIVYDGVDLVHWSNQSDSITKFESGIFGITNAHLQANSPRARLGQRKYEQLSSKHSLTGLLSLLAPSETHCSNDCFLVGDSYGTRASTVVIFGTNTILFCEQQFGPSAEMGTQTTQEIRLRS